MAAPFEITLENLEDYTKAQIQDENVKYGLARCDNELKEKSVRKLREHLESLLEKTTCVIKLDDGPALEYTYPAGKTRLDLNKLLLAFFKPST
jgi:hypothetical protein